MHRPTPAHVASSLNHWKLLHNADRPAIRGVDRRRCGSAILVVWAPLSHIRLSDTGRAFGVLRRSLAVGLAVLLSGGACSGKASSGAADSPAFAGHWTNDGPAPLSQMITGLELRRGAAGYRGTLFLSGRSLEGTGVVHDGELSMRFPTAGDTFTVRGIVLPDGGMSVTLVPPRSTDQVSATLTRTR
jgi:hypothetical protein